MARTTYLGAYSVADGYAGRRTVAHFVWDCGYILQVYPYGFHRSDLPHLYGQVQDAAEALWRLDMLRRDPRGYLRQL